MATFAPKGSTPRTFQDGRERFQPASRWVKYREGLWIPVRKKNYVYWYKFLQVAEREPQFTVDWSKYRGWGGSKVVLSTRFDDWWEKRWARLFGVKNQTDTPRFPMTTKQVKTDAYRTALMVYEHQDIGSHMDIARAIQKIELRSRYGVQSFGDADMDDNAAYINIQRMVSRYKKRARTILQNVSEGRFP